MRSCYKEFVLPEGFFFFIVVVRLNHGIRLIRVLLNLIRLNLVRLKRSLL